MELDDLFYITARIIIVLPIIVIIIALVLKFNQTPVPAVKQIIKLTPTFFPTNTLISSSSAQLNLTGPLICYFSSPGVSISVYIKDKKILATVKEKDKVNNFLLNSDCLYVWEKDSYSGSIKCGLSSYIKMINNMSLEDIFNTSSLVGFSLPDKFGDKEYLINSCKKEEIKDIKVFEIPKNVVFR